MMKVYLAAAYKHHEITGAVVARALRDAGATVVSSWHDEPHVPGGDNAVDDATRQNIANVCTEQVKASDVLVFLMAEGGEPRGARVEMGIAIGRGIDVVILDIDGTTKSDVFHAGRMRVENVQELVDALLGTPSVIAGRVAAALGEGYAAGDFCGTPVVRGPGRQPVAAVSPDRKIKVSGVYHPLTRDVLAPAKTVRGVKSAVRAILAAAAAEGGAT
jgi:nucleoside 2-deoxyribosyltransferase